MKKHDLQEFAELLRDIAYSDNQSHHIDWHLSVVHPRTNDGDVGFSGGLWNRIPLNDKTVSISFSFSETRGIYNFKLWRNRSEIRFNFGETPTYGLFKDICIQEFGIERLFRQ